MRGTRSVRPIWLCHELELPVEIEPIDFAPAFRDSAQWRAISPAGKVPAMVDGDLTMFESGAMVDYILERYGNMGLLGGAEVLENGPSIPIRHVCGEHGWQLSAHLSDRQ